ncbi:hypothetical protein E2562_030891 [Oryza meyeriana var. granulata]|uniref:F-box domain-containing protein n=1 Tax=Oryza meyeriana var. granulata TaxID=110450 RepID=A0A6G1F055_9ORYZ|nr:hypothetical protein E2562_030891 [Oryza meyeriana var. granulata]
MAGEHEEAASFWLPDDILIHILSNLPAKSVVRFRSVSRSWRDMLSSASFVELHLRRANRPDQLKVFFLSAKPTDAEHPDKCYFYSRQLPGGPAKKLMREDFAHGQFAAPVTKPLHGLVLMRCTSLHGGYYVCNPSTNAVLALPDSKFPLKSSLRIIPHSSRRDWTPGYTTVSYGFGYCSATGEHKVVRLFSDTFSFQAADTCSEVFVLDTPAFWRPTAQQPPPECTFEEDNPAVFLNGLLYFLCRNGGVITFNVSDETFGSAPPPPVDVDEVGEVTLTEFDGCLGAFYQEAHSDNYAYHIWLLRDHAHEAAHWEQLCRIDMAA